MFMLFFAVVVMFMLIGIAYTGRAIDDVSRVVSRVVRINPGSVVVRMFGRRVVVHRRPRRRTTYEHAAYMRGYRNGRHESRVMSMHVPDAYDRIDDESRSIMDDIRRG